MRRPSQNKQNKDGAQVDNLNHVMRKLTLTIQTLSDVRKNICFYGDSCTRNDYGRGCTRYHPRDVEEAMRRSLLMQSVDATFDAASMVHSFRAIPPERQIVSPPQEVPQDCLPPPPPPGLAPRSTLPPPPDNVPARLRSRLGPPPGLSPRPSKSDIN